MTKSAITRTLQLLLMSGVVALGACDDGTTMGSAPAAVVTNPTGSCGTKPNFGREGYSGPGATWVLDCQNPLRREYYRVYTEDGTIAWTLPRVDGNPALKPACDDPQDPLHGVVTSNMLCAGASTDEELFAVNHMPIADALLVTHFLHGQLQFAVVEGFLTDIHPYAIPEDIFDACALHANSPELEEMCARERDTTPRPAYGHSGPAAVQLAARLNELYGAPAP